MASVVVKPSGLVVVVDPDETILQAAQRQNIAWPTTCGGVASCGMCVVRVLAGAQSLPPRSKFELDRIDKIRSRPMNWHEPDMRLACATRPRADLVVHHVGVRGGADAGGNMRASEKDAGDDGRMLSASHMPDRSAALSAYERPATEWSRPVIPLKPRQKPKSDLARPTCLR